MALEKEIISSNGTVESYHRIASISNEHGIVMVTIFSYIDKEYREKEIEITTKQKRQFYLGETIAKMCEVPPEERSEEYEAEIQALMAEERTLGPEIWQAGQLYSSEHHYQLDMTSYEDITFEAIYAELEKLDDFNGSTVSDVESPYKLEQRIETLEKTKPILASPFTNNSEPTGIASQFYDTDELIAIYEDDIPVTVKVTMPIGYDSEIIVGLNAEKYYGG